MRDSLKERYIREVEPERYELFAGPAYDFEITRRDACRLLGGGMLLVLLDPALGADQEDAPNRLSARLHIGVDSTVTLLTGKVEMGQGSRTLLAQAAAEELRLAPERIRLIMGDTDLVPDDGGTWASLTTPETVPLVRRAAAAARVLLTDLAAKKLAAEAASLTVRDGRISGPGGNGITYAELVREGGWKEALDKDTPLRPPAEWEACGRPVKPLLGRDIVTGAQKYSGDLSVPGMLHGRMVRSPYYLPSLESFDGSRAEKMGARVVRDNHFLGVVASDPNTAEGAAAAVRAQWTGKELTPLEDLIAHFKSKSEAPKLQAGVRYPPLIQQGDLAAGMAQARVKHEAAYTVAPIAHAPLEPRAAIAAWEGGRLTVWYGGQAPFMVRRELAEAFRIPVSAVRVISCEIGGGFGGKQRGEVAVEAARLAKDAGKPVKLVWSREEEFLWSYFRPAGIVEVKSGVDASGRVTAWDFRNYNSGASGLALPYAIPNYSCGFHRSTSPLRQGSYRSLAAAANTFARERHMEELASLTKTDSVQFRLRNIENPRLRHVIERAAERFGWGKSAAGRGVGMAATTEKGAHLALFVALVVRGKKVNIEKMVLAFDCGAVMNPDNLRNQLTGGLIQGIGGALFEEVRYDARSVLNASYSEYRVPRFSDVPAIEVMLIDRRDQPSTGAGEAPITMPAPAIAAAIFHATGKNLRSLPLEGGLVEG